MNETTMKTSVLYMFLQEQSGNSDETWIYNPRQHIELKKLCADCILLKIDLVAYMGRGAYM